MAIDPTTGKPRFDPKEFDEQSKSASMVTEQRLKTQQLRKAQVQKFNESEPSVSKEEPEEPEKAPPKLTVSLDGP